MAFLTKKTIFQRSTTFFAHFAIFIFLISFFSFSHPTHARLTFCCMPQKSSVGGLLHQIADAVPQNFSKSNITFLGLAQQYVSMFTGKAEAPTAPAACRRHALPPVGLRA